MRVSKSESGHNLYIGPTGEVALESTRTMCFWQAQQETLAGQVLPFYSASVS